MSVEEVRTDKHIEDVIKLAVEFHEETSQHLTFEADQIRRYGRAIQNDFDRESYNAWVAYKNDEPVGFLVATCSEYFFSRQLSARQELWFVKQGHRGSRIAFDLIRAFEDWGRLLGAVELFTGVATGDVPKQRKISRILEKIGYPRVGSYHKRVTTDAG